MDTPFLRLQCLQTAHAILGEQRRVEVFDMAEKIYEFTMGRNKPIRRSPDFVFPHGFHPYPFQTRLSKTILNEHRLVISKARQMGVSTVLASCIDHLMRHEPMQKIVVMGSNMDIARMMIENVKRIMRLDKPVKNQIHLENGSLLIACPLDRNSLRGVDPTMIVIDEVTTDLNEVLTPAIRDSITCKIIVASTPMHPSFNELCLDRFWQQVSLPYFLFPGRDEDFMREMKERIGKEAFRREYCCEFQ
jgi:hypothetical protein